MKTNLENWLEKRDVLEEIRDIYSGVMPRAELESDLTKAEQEIERILRA